MQIQVHAPDGSIVEFPEGTDDATITSVMRREYGGPEPQAAPHPAAPPAPAGAAQAAYARMKQERGVGGGPDAALLEAVAFGGGGELSGAANYAETAAKNLIARLKGETPAFGARDAYRVAAADFGNDLAKFRREQPIANAAVTAGGLLAQGPAKMASRFVARAPGLLSATARSAGVGAAYGGANAYGAGEGGLLGRVPGAVRGAASGAAMGGALGPVARLAQSGANAVTIAGKASLPAVQAAKKAAYDAVDKAGVRYAPQAYSRLVADIETGLQNVSIDPALHPKASAMLRQLKARAVDKKGVATGFSPTITQLDQIRQVVGRDVARASDEAEQFMGRQIIDKIDEFIESAGKKDAVAGTAKAASDAVKKARDLNARYRKLSAVDEALEKARTRTGSTGSGGNIDNATRQNLRGVMERTRNLTPEERDAFERAIIGTKSQNALRAVGKLSPAGGGLMGLLNFGLAGGGAAVGQTQGALVGMIPGTAGVVAKFAADSITQARVEQLRKVIAEGGPAASAAIKIAQQNPSLARGLTRLGVSLEASTGSQMGSGRPVAHAQP